MIDAGADIHHRGKQGDTALMHAAGKKKSVGVLQLLISAGADVHAKDNDGKTGLFSACYTGNTEAIKLLLAAGAKVDHADKNGIQPIHYAVEKGYQQSHTLGHEEVVKMLLKAGAKIDVMDKDGWQPIHYAADGVNASLIKDFVEFGADVNATASDGLTPLQIARKRDVWGRVYRTLKAAGAK